MEKVKNQFLMVLAFVLITGCHNKLITNEKSASVKVKVASVCVEARNPDYYTGTVKESVSIPLSFTNTGQVEKVFVSEGQKVKKGQALAFLNAESFHSAWEIASAKEKQAKDAYDRLLEVYKKGSLPEIKFVEIETSLAQAQAMTKIAEKNLRDCKLFAPADGIIGTRSIEPGANVIPGNTVFTIVEIDKIFVNISVPEKEISQTQPGQKAVITVSALNGEIFEGEITQKGVVANPVSHTYNIKISLDNSAGKLLPGMVCQVSVSNNLNTTYFVVPQQAVQISGEGNKFVYLVSKSSQKAIKQNIITGGIHENGVIVEQGLHKYDSIIVEGYQNIDENSNILIIQ
jgi:membrane fusion protein (multidrug efflux system)